MLEPNDVVGVALSGGKDSVTLLRILCKIEKRYPHAKLAAVTIDEGISGYRDEAISISAELCRDLGVEHYVTSFAELFGVTMDRIANERTELRPCSYCGVLRRKALNEAARHVGATKLATGHNLDDEAQTALLNVMHGDVERMVRVPVSSQMTLTGFVPRIKPLSSVPERETMLYAYTTGSRFQSAACPHGNDALRGDIRSMLNRLEFKHPGLKYTICSSVDKLSGPIAATKLRRRIRSCILCGSLTPNDVCEPCTMLKSLNVYPLATGA